MRKPLTWMAAALLSSTSVACGPKAPAPETSKAAADVVADAAPAKPSRLSEGRSFFGRVLKADGVTPALALADALAAEDTPEAKLTSARVRLLTVAQAAQSGFDLGEGGAEKQLRLALAAGESEADVKTAANAMLGALANQRDTWPEPEALAPILTEGRSPESMALRITALALYNTASKTSLDQGFAAFLKSFGPFVCKACNEAATDAVLTETFACKAPKAAYCAPLDAARATLPVASIGANAAALAALDVAVRASHFESALAAAIKAPTSVPLPVPVQTEGGTELLGTGSLAAKGVPMAVLDIGATGIRIGLRPVIDATGKDILPDSIVRSQSLSLEALAEAEPKPDNGAIEAITDRTSTIFDSPEVAGMTRALVVNISTSVTPALIAKALDAVDAAQGKAFNSRFLLRPGTHGDTLPAYLRSIPLDIEARLSPNWARPIIVVVNPESIDVWAPEGKKGSGALIGPDLEAKLPTSVEPGWRGAKLARLRVPLPPMQAAVERFNMSVTQGLADALKTYIELANAGRVIHLVAGENASTADVLRVGRHLTENLGPDFSSTELADPSSAWPQSLCRDGNACATSVPVFFSKAQPPSERGLSNKPGKEEKEPKEAEPKEPKQAPSAEFCNQADIKSQMAKRAGAFRFCYERELQLNKDLAGRLVMSFVITLDGGVRGVRAASNDLGNNNVANCITKEIAKLKFKAPDGGECVVQWPFKFSAN